MNWVAVKGIIKQGYQVASGNAADSPYPRGTIEMQKPFFQELGLDISSFFPGTLNISIAPKTYKIILAEFTFKNVKWNPNFAPETFSFFPCRIVTPSSTYEGLIYYPHPETKIGHFQDKSTLEILAPFIPNLHYGNSIQLELNSQNIVII